MSKLRKILQVFKALLHDLKTRPLQLSPPLPIGLSEIDECLWGLHTKELMIIAGRPSNGKTSLSLHIALNIAKAKHSVLYFSFEETVPQILQRILCTVGKIDNLKMRRYALNEEDYKTTEAIYNLFLEWQFGIIDDLRSVEDIEKIIMKCANGNKTPKVVIIDYVQLLDWTHYENKRDAIEFFILRLRKLAQKLSIALVICSQINRTSESRRDKRPTLSEIKGAGAQEEHADSVVCPYYPCREEIKEKDNIEIMELMILKQRHGMCERFKVRFQPQYYLFSDVKRKEGAL